MPPFPIFRLPYVNLRTVLNIIDRSEIVRLAMCSKETRRILKTMDKTVSRKSLSIEDKENISVLEMMELLRLEVESSVLGSINRIQVGILISDNIGLEVNVLTHIGVLKFEIYTDSVNHQDRIKGDTANLKIADVEAPAVMTTKNELHTFWNKKYDGFKVIAACFRKIFNMKKVYKFYINGGSTNEFSENLRFAINWINSNNIGLHRCEMDAKKGNIANDDFEYFLDNVSPFHALELNPRKKNEFTIKKRFNSKVLHVNNANWFTIDNLKMIGCKLIFLHDSPLKNEDLKEYLNEWLTGKLPMLKHFYVSIQENVMFDTIFSGFPGYSQKGEVPRSEYTIIWDNDYITMKCCDGKIARIRTTDVPTREFRMEIV